MKCDKECGGLDIKRTIYRKAEQTKRLPKQKQHTLCL